LADIVVVCVLKEAFVRLFEPAFRKPFAKVCAWFESCCAMKQFDAVLGKVALCKQAEKPQAVKAAFAPPARGAAAAPAPKKEAKKEEPKKAEAKKAAEPKAKAAAAPAAAAAALSPEVEAQIKAVGDDIRTLKEKLKSEGLSGAKINQHEDIKKLVDKLSALKSGTAAPAAAPKAKAAAAPAAGGGDLDAQVKQVGDKIRALKEKLKAEGLSGKKINEHPEVKDLVGKLSELKAAQ